MLNLSRIQSGFKDFSKTVVQANDLIDPIGEKYKAVCGERGLTLHIMDGSNELPALYTNAACVSEILEILLDNAKKFTKENGSIWLEWSVSAKHVTICVRDEGIGIGKEAQSRIFQRFFKEGNDSRGSGLGLAIAEEIARGLGEKIWVQSEPGKGASFYFTVARAFPASTPLVIKKLQQTSGTFPDL
jgi:signal transduction histidine kinase